MITFIIQCENVKGNLIPAFDFCYELIQAIQYNNWFRNEIKYDFVLAEKVTVEHGEYIPVGSIEFVESHMRICKGKNNIRPLNIPEELYPFANRFVARGERPDVWQHMKQFKTLFVKSDDVLKGYSNVCNVFTNLPGCKFFISEIVNFKSEWRCFVNNNQLIDCKHYDGEFDISPDFNRVNDMIKAYNSAPDAYVLDVGITDKGETVIVECHNFISCGLYGFANYGCLPSMFYRGYKWQLEHTDDICKK